MESRTLKQEVYGDKALMKRLIEETGCVYYRYDMIVSGLIREKYSISDELALHRQRDSKPEEVVDYNAFEEDCKTLAKEKWAAQEAAIERIRSEMTDSTQEGE